MTHTPLTDQQLAEYEQLATRITGDPFFVADCEGKLAVWREKVLTHVRRDEHGQIDTYSLPSSYQSTDEVIETIHLDSWDPGEDASDDRATVLREAADAAAEQLQRNPWTTAADVIDELRRMAAESASAVVVRRATDETPGEVCGCGHGRAYHDFEYGGPRCRLCPERGEWKWNHAFTAEVGAQQQPKEARP